MLGKAYLTRFNNKFKWMIDSHYKKYTMIY